MDIYFVRHGQTDGNVARRHQHPNIELNERGKEQAKQVARRLRSLRPTHLITSTNLRAVETARHIGLATDLIPETYPAFEELHRPTWLIGSRFTTKDTLTYVWGWFFGITAASMHDGETYEHFLTRLAAARAHLMTLPEDARVVIVSHAVFINFFLEHMVAPERMGLRRAALRLVKIFRLKNATVTHVRFSRTGGGEWRFVQRF